MPLKRIFWSLLAGVSISLTGCEDGGPDPQPEYGVPVDTLVDQLNDGIDSVETDALADVEQEESPIVPMYGTPEYGVPAP